MSADEEDRLLADVIAAPDDDAPRLVYADWLQQRGDPRGEFIALQVHAARLPAGDPRATELAAAAHRLYEAHENAWHPRIEGLIDGPTYQRGFLESVALPGRHLVASAAVFFRTVVVRELTLDGGSDEELRQIASMPELRRLRKLQVTAGVSDAGFAALAASPHLGGLRELKLHGNRIGVASMHALAQAPWSAGLSLLRLISNPVGRAGVDALAASPHLRCRELWLQNGGLDDASVQTLAGSPILDGIIKLVLSQNFIGAASGEALAASPHVRSLEHLELYKTNVSNAGARALASSPHLSRLSTLDLNEAGIGDDGAIALAHSGKLTALQNLYLSSNGIGERGAEALAAHEGLPALTTLSLGGNSLYVPDAVEEWVEGYAVHGAGPVQLSLALLRARYGKTVHIAD